LFGWFLAFIHLVFLYLYLLGAGIYLISAIFTGLGAKSERYPVNLKLKLAVFIGIIVSHFVYGIWFVKGLLVSKLPEE
jgi:hypothetical protein